MLLSIKYNFLFIHIAKTGGTSIRSALQRYRWRDPHSWVQALCNRLSSLYGHRLGVKIPRHAKAICAKELLPNELFERLFKFAFVRNPWDLQVSSWHHIQRERPHIIPGNVRDFHDFIRWKLDKDRPYHYIVDTSMELQTDYLLDLHGRPIVDFVGRYEHLREHFNEACRRIGIKTPPLPHKRRAKDRDKDYRPYYNEKTAMLIEEHFKRDVELLGYGFDSIAPEGPIILATDK